MENDHNQPLLPAEEVTVNSSSSSSATFAPQKNDIKSINGVRDFFPEFGVESKKLWYLAGPLIFMSFCRYSLGAITHTFAGHLGTLELDAFAVEKSVIAGFCFGIMVLYYKIVGVGYTS